MTTPKALKVLLVISTCLFYASSGHAWEYVLNNSEQPSPFLVDLSGFEGVTVDKRGDLIACGPIGVSGAPLHVVKVSGSAGAQMWDFGMPASGNWKSYSDCNFLAAGPENELFIAASIAERDYTVNYFDVTKISPDGSEGWRFSAGVLSRSSSRSSAYRAIPDPSGDVIAGGRIDQADYSDPSMMVKIAGDNGRELWHRHVSSRSGGFPKYLVDSVGDILIDGTAVADANGDSPRLIKIAGADGNEIWRYGQSTAWSEIEAMVLDDLGNAIVSGGGMFSKIASASGGEIWSTQGNPRTLLLGPAGIVLAVNFYPFYNVTILAGATGLQVAQFDLEHQIDSCHRIAIDPGGDLFGVCEYRGLTKWSGKSGAVLWNRPIAQSDSFQNLVVDPLGDVTLAGQRSLPSTPPGWGNENYWDRMAVLQKYWGKTGADFPPSALDRVGYLGSLVLEVVTDHGIANSLMVKLERATGLLENGDPANDTRAASFLRAFVNQVKALAGKRISADDANELISETEKAIEALSAT